MARKTKVEDYAVTPVFYRKTAIPDYPKTAGFIKLSFLRKHQKYSKPQLYKLGIWNFYIGISLKLSFNLF
jgi:hypothetical protein